MNYQKWCGQVTVEKIADSVVKAWHWRLGLSLEGGSCSKSFIVLQFSGKNGPSLLCSAGILSVTNVSVTQVVAASYSGLWLELCLCRSVLRALSSLLVTDHHWICWQTVKSSHLLFFSLPWAVFQSKYIPVVMVLLYSFSLHQKNNHQLSSAEQ